MIYTESGEPVATSFTRLVVGERGAYLEFKKENIIIKNINMPTDQKWRPLSCRQNKAFYIEYRTNQDNIKIYYQKKTVTYADYLIDHLYIALDDIYIKVNDFYIPISNTGD